MTTFRTLEMTPRPGKEHRPSIRESLLKIADFDLSPVEHPYLRRRSEDVVSASLKELGRFDTIQVKDLYRLIDSTTMSFTRLRVLAGMIISVMESLTIQRTSRNPFIRFRYFLNASQDKVHLPKVITVKRPCIVLPPALRMTDQATEVLERVLKKIASTGPARYDSNNQEVYEISRSDLSVLQLVEAGNDDAGKLLYPCLQPFIDRSGHEVLFEIEDKAIVVKPA